MVSVSGARFISTSEDLMALSSTCFCITVSTVGIGESMGRCFSSRVYRINTDTIAIDKLAIAAKAILVFRSRRGFNFSFSISELADAEAQVLAADTMNASRH